MKKMIAALMILMLLFSLVACRKTEAPQTTTSSAVPTAPTVVAPSSETTATEADFTVYQQPLSAISMPLVSEETYADDGTLIFSYRYQNVFPILQDSSVANAVSVDLLNRIDAYRSEAESIRNAAMQAYTALNWTPFFCNTVYNPMRIDQGILSLCGSNITYQGGAHSNTISLSATYDLVTGKVLSLDDILSDTCTTEQLVQAIFDALSPISDSLYPEYRTVISDRFSGNYVWSDYPYTEDWYFSNTGLCFYFSPYDIAPYFMGTVTAEIPYEQLSGILKDDYFPAETITYSGTISAELFHPSKLEKYSQFAEVILNRDGQTLLLSTDAYVRDITIEVGQTLSEDTNSFFPTGTVFAAECITAGDAIMLQANIPTDSPTLRLRYSNGTQMQEALILINPDDGSVLLK